MSFDDVMGWLDRDVPKIDARAKYFDGHRQRDRANPDVDILDTDEIVYFASPPLTWRNLCGRSGWAVVRDGKVIDFIVTMLS